MEIVTALAPEPEDITEKRLREVLNALVLGYGGDPRDSRQRLDNLIDGVCHHER